MFDSVVSVGRKRKDMRGSSWFGLPWARRWYRRASVLSDAGPLSPSEVNHISQHVAPHNGTGICQQTVAGQRTKMTKTKTGLRGPFHGFDSVLGFFVHLTALFHILKGKNVMRLGVESVTHEHKRRF